MRLDGVLEDRDAWTTRGRCPIEKAMSVVGSRSAMLVMREAFYGTTRFDDFADRVGMSPATASANLKGLVDAGLLDKRAYRPEGERTRHEYVLTDSGRDLMPVVFGLFQWGEAHADAPVPLRLAHIDCDAPVRVEMRCADGHRLSDDEIALRVHREGHPRQR
ncbi:transcriptional regulator family protein [Gordonia spumicola]|uniref:Transcriptional regulator family protein n=1 Tax=Gordonia spumicola TaxID=589161 RepID=A0A7I9VE14_9ACTN|nr:transcriptional regulator family protein [Gordonia spumicola]